MTQFINLILTIGIYSYSKLWPAGLERFRFCEVTTSVQAILLLANRGASLLAGKLQEV
jgi:hypothetical protein